MPSPHRTWPQRSVQVCTAAVGVLLGALGLLTAPTAILIACGFAALLIGPGAAILTYNTLTQTAPTHTASPAHRTALRVGAAATLTSMALAVLTAGLVAVLGLVAGLVITLGSGAGIVWGWRHRGTCRARLDQMITPRPEAPGGHRRGDRRRRRNLRLAEGATGSAPRLPQDRLSTMHTTALCIAWQRSYWLLRDLPAGQARGEVVELRRGLLDELEHRDPDGVRRWLQTEPRAGSDPGRYLTADHRPSHYGPPPLTVITADWAGHR